VTGATGSARLVLATHNRGKLIELRRLMAEVAPELTVLGLDDVAAYPEPAETESSFEGNALLKARACVAVTGEAALADDSGLEVDVLNRMPGVRSARWAGPEGDDEANNTLLLRQLHDVPPERRTARFVCAVALVTPDGRELVRHGRMEGRVIHAPRGDGGFGYDPLFVAEGHTRTSAELSPAEKDAVSHRGRAMREVVPLVAAMLSGGPGQETTR